MTDVMEHEADTGMDTPRKTDPLRELEAMVMCADRPAPAAKLGEALTALLGAEITPEHVAELIARLNESYAEGGHAFRIEEVGGGYRVMTLPEHAEAVAGFQRLRASTRLSRAALETLAIIAYRQPITRADLEGIRGVGCGEILRTLLDRNLVTIKGRAEELGRPMLYGTTSKFLDVFGLPSLKSLPKPGELGLED